MHPAGQPGWNVRLALRPELFTRLEGVFFAERSSRLASKAGGPLLSGQAARG